MKPTIICDIDCTLYSYSEFIKTNVFYPKESMKALFSIPTGNDYFPAVERTWKVFENHIEERVARLIEETSSHGSILFLSAFPAEYYKKKTFDKLSLQMVSSYPNRKIDLLKMSEELRVILTIGDRPNDKGISKVYNSKLVYIPIYKPIHALSGKRYTTKLIQTIKESLNS